MNFFLKLHKIDKRQDKTCFFLRVYYREVKSLRLIENSHNKTLTFLFGSVLIDDVLIWGRFNRKLGPFWTEVVFDWGRFEWQPCLRTCAVRI